MFLFTLLSFVVASVFGALELADAYLTRVGLAEGTQELNPIGWVQWAVKHPYFLYPTKFALSSPWFVLPFVLPHYKPWPLSLTGQLFYWGVPAGLIGLMCYVVKNNLAANAAVKAAKAAPPFWASATKS
jgi:hypothetical protein